MVVALPEVVVQMGGEEPFANPADQGGQRLRFPCFEQAAHPFRTGVGLAEQTVAGIHIDSDIRQIQTLDHLDHQVGIRKRRIVRPG